MEFIDTLTRVTYFPTICKHEEGTGENNKKNVVLVQSHAKCCHLS